MRGAVIALVLAAMPSVAAARVPRDCSVGVTVVAAADHGTLTGKLTRFEPRRREPQFIEATLDDGTTAVELTLYVAPGLRAASAPLAKLARGATVTLTYRCGGGWQRVCDARIEDARGALVLIASGTGGDGLAAGWTATVGAIIATRPDPAPTTAASVERTHEVELRHGKVVAKVRSGRCTRITEGGHTYLATGTAVTWLGVRPPEGVDWRSYSLVRQR